MSEIQKKPIAIPENIKPFLWLFCYKQDDDGDTELHLLVAKYPQTKDRLERLIHITVHPAMLNIANNDGVTALHLAAMSSYPAVIRLIMGAGANPLLRDCWGWIPLHHACKTGIIDVINALILPFSSEEIKRITGFARLPNLLDGVEARNYQYQTPLHIAVENGHLEAVKLLTTLGADIGMIDLSGKTPLKIAISHEYKLITTFILKQYKKNWKEHMQYDFYSDLGKHLDHMGLEELFIKTLKITKSKLYPPPDSPNELSK